MQPEENKTKEEPNIESLDDAIESGDYDVEVSEDDFFDSLDEGIDNYFQNLNKKK